MVDDKPLYMHWTAMSETRIMFQLSLMPAPPHPTPHTPLLYATLSPVNKSVTVPGVTWEHVATVHTLSHFKRLLICTPITFLEGCQGLFFVRTSVGGGTREGNQFSSFLLGDLSRGSLVAWLENNLNKFHLTALAVDRFWCRCDKD